MTGWQDAPVVEADPPSQPASASWRDAPIYAMPKGVSPLTWDRTNPAYNDWWDRRLGQYARDVGGPIMQAEELLKASKSKGMLASTFGSDELDRAKSAVRLLDQQDIEGQLNKLDQSPNEYDRDFAADLRKRMKHLRLLNVPEWLYVPARAATVMTAGIPEAVYALATGEEAIPAATGPQEAAGHAGALAGFMGGASARGIARAGEGAVRPLGLNPMVRSFEAGTAAVKGVAGRIGTALPRLQRAWDTIQGIPVLNRAANAAGEIAVMQGGQIASAALYPDPQQMALAYRNGVPLDQAYMDQLKASTNVGTEGIIMALAFGAVRKPGLTPYQKALALGRSLQEAGIRGIDAAKLPEIVQAAEQARSELVENPQQALSAMEQARRGREEQSARIDSLAARPSFDPSRLPNAPMGYPAVQEGRLTPSERPANALQTPQVAPGQARPEAAPTVEQAQPSLTEGKAGPTGTRTLAVLNDAGTPRLVYKTTPVGVYIPGGEGTVPGFRVWSLEGEPLGSRRSENLREPTPEEARSAKPAPAAGGVEVKPPEDRFATEARADLGKYRQNYPNERIFEEEVQRRAASARLNAEQAPETPAESHRDRLKREAVASGLSENGVEAALRVQDAIGETLVRKGKIKSVEEVYAPYSVERATMEQAHKAGAKQGDRAFIDFLDDGKAVIRLLRSADVTSLAHEIAHGNRSLLSKHLPDHMRVIEDAMSVKGGKWERVHEERFARAFERYLRDGKAPTEPLRAAFEAIKNFFLDIYKAIGGKHPLSLKGLGMTEAQWATTRRIFDQFMGGKGTPQRARSAGEEFANRAKVKAQEGELRPWIDQYIRKNGIHTSEAQEAIDTTDAQGFSTSFAGSLPGEVRDRLRDMPPAEQRKYRKYIKTNVPGGMGENVDALGGWDGWWERMDRMVAGKEGRLRADLDAAESHAMSQLDFDAAAKVRAYRELLDTGVAHEDLAERVRFESEKIAAEAGVDTAPEDLGGAFDFAGEAAALESKAERTPEEQAALDEARELMQGPHGTNLAQTDLFGKSTGNLFAIPEKPKAAPAEPAKPMTKQDRELAEIARKFPGQEERLFQAPAYHGSPHSFDKFSMSKIGTGEGAQAFGHGLYFTSEEAVAKHYANMRGARVMLDGKPIEDAYYDGNRPNYEIQAYDDLRQQGSVDAAIQSLEKRAKTVRENPDRFFPRTSFQSKSVESMASLNERAATWLRENAQRVAIEPSRNLYSVDLWKNKQENVLEWEKPAPASTIQAVRDELQRESYRQTGTTDQFEANLELAKTGKLGIPSRRGELTGEQFYRMLSRTLGGDEWASRILDAAGIDGIKYKAGTLSGVKSEAYNYVVFDENAIKINKHTLFQSGQGDLWPPERLQRFKDAITAVKYRKVDAELEAMGKAPTTPAERITLEEKAKEADATVRENPFAASGILEDVKKRNRPLETEEVFILLRQRAEMRKGRDRLDAELEQAKKSGDPAAIASAEAAVKTAQATFADVANTMRQAVTKNAQALGAMRAELNADYSLAEMERVARESTEGKTAAERDAALAKVKQLHDLIASQEQEIAKQTARADEAASKAEYEKAQRKLVEAAKPTLVAKPRASRATSRKYPGQSKADLLESLKADLQGAAMFQAAPGGEALTPMQKLTRHAYLHMEDGGRDMIEWGREVVDAVGEKVRPRLKQAWESARKEFSETQRKDIAQRAQKRVAKSKNPEDVGQAAQRLARIHVENGVTDREALIDAVHADLKEAVPNITRRQTMDAISGYGVFRPAPKDPTSVILRDLKGQMQQVGKLEDMAGGQAPRKTGFERRSPSDIERGLIRDVGEAKRAGGYESTDPEAELASGLQSMKTRLRNQIVDLSKQLAEGRQEIREGRKIQEDADARRIREERDALRDMYNEVFGNKPKTDAQRLAEWKKRAEALIAKYQARTKVADFAVKARPQPPKLDPAGLDARYRLDKAKREWNEQRAKWLRENLTAGQKAKLIVGEIGNLPRAIMTSFDVSAPLRQGAFIAFGHPVRAIRDIGTMFRALVSEKAAFAVDEAIRRDPMYQEARAAGLELTEHGQNFNAAEEAYRSRWGEKIPGVKQSARAYTSFLNKLRFESYKAMARKLSLTGEPALAEAKVIADYINAATGRGAAGSLTKTAAAVNSVFFAPRFAISRLQLLTLQPIWGARAGYAGTAKARTLVAKEYARFLAGAAVVLAVGMAAGGKVETDPRSTDFGKLRFGDTRVDPWAGMQQWTVFLTREIRGETKTARGEVKSLTSGKFGQPTRYELFTRFLRGKLQPMYSTAVDVGQGENIVGEPVTPGSLAWHFAPLAVQDIYDVMKAQGVPAGTAFAVLAMFGMGMQTYEPTKAKGKPSSPPRPARPAKPAGSS